VRTKQRFTFMMDRKYAFASISVPEDLAERRDGGPAGPDLSALPLSTRRDTPNALRLQRAGRKPTD
jgi:hypothetical protein